jgi:CDP-diacylglycerol--serine O-phosphatidyltransferase
MRLRPLPRRRRGQPLLTIQVLPTLVTLGNLLAGVLALAYLEDSMGATDPAVRDGLWSKAAWLVFLGMFCDALDGRIARLTRTTSPFGAQLDSLADVVTFGLVPAFLSKTMLSVTFPSVSPRLLLALSVVYVGGAALRLARYNVESARVSPGGAPHVTLVFRGMPSPAAAGLLASVVLLRLEYALPALGVVLAFLTPVVGLLMVSRLPYPHVLNRWLEGRRGIPAMVLLAVTLFLVLAFFLETIAAVFVAYALSGPVLFALARLTGRPRWALFEEDDEADLGDVEDDEAPRALGG